MNLIGKELGPYRIVAKIGSGGMATIFKAYQPAMDRYVAVKVLPPFLADDEAFVQRFQQEAQAISKLEHPRILPVYDYGQQDDMVYIAIRYVESGTLQERMARGKIPLADINHFIRQIASALEHAHQKGIIHRDVKPSNVLIDQNDNIYLSDFGLARILESSQQFTGSGVSIGTPAYMSPEQGKGEKADHRSDIYSLGIILYELVTGQVPYQAETPLAVLLKHITDPLPLPHTLSTDIPEPVERVILKALAKEPSDRYQSAGDLADALETAVYQTTHPINIPPTPTSPEQPSLIARIRQRWHTRRGKIVMVGMATAVLLLFSLLITQLNNINIGITGNLDPTAEVPAVAIATTSPTNTPSPTSTQPPAVTTAPTNTPTPPAPTKTPTIEATIETAMMLATTAVNCSEEPGENCNSAESEAAAPFPMADTSDAVLSGHVTDAETGEGINGAVISVTILDGKTISTTSSLGGSYVFPVLRSGEYQLEVSSPNYVTQYYDNKTSENEATTIQIAPLTQQTNIDFNLTPAGSISGYIFQSDGQAPIVEAEIIIQPFGEDLSYLGYGYKTHSNSDGSYAVSGLPSGEYFVGVTAGGWIEQYYSGKGQWPFADPVVVQPRQTTSEINFTMEKGGSISGFVYEADGVTPIANAGVGITGELPNGELVWFGSFTESDGSYVINDAHPANYLINASKTDYATEYYNDAYLEIQASLVSVQRGETLTDINFTLERGNEIQGHVFEGDGITPVFGGCVVPFLPTGERGAAMSCPGEDGWFSLWLPPGNYILSTDTARHVHEWYDGAFEIHQAMPISVSDGGSVLGINFTLVKAGWISGYVFQDDGVTPIANAHVTAFPQSGKHPGEGANTRSDGSYTIERLPPGDYLVEVNTSGFSSQFYPFVKWEEEAEIVTVTAQEDTTGIDFVLIPSNE